jgi:ABC-type phosphate transport system substrate-binding protein
MTGRFMATVGALCGVVAALLLAGCGGSTSKSAATTPPTKAKPAKPTPTISATALKSCLDASGASS